MSHIRFGVEPTQTMGIVIAKLPNGIKLVPLYQSLCCGPLGETWLICLPVGFSVSCKQIPTFTPSPTTPYSPSHHTLSPPLTCTYSQLSTFISLCHSLCSLLYSLFPPMLVRSLSVSMQTVRADFFTRSLF